MLHHAAPVLASLNMRRTLDFYVEKLGFQISYDDANYGIVHRDQVELHFWKCEDPIHPQNTSCYVYVKEINTLYAEMKAAEVIHPNGTLTDQPWGILEFSILDIDGNLIRFGENVSP
ncbi:MAG: VOC family protein [Bacteroidota bacterium]